jgi:hypothetical protein
MKNIRSNSENKGKVPYLGQPSNNNPQICGLTSE